MFTLNISKKYRKVYPHTYMCVLMFRTVKKYSKSMMKMKIISLWWCIEYWKCVNAHTGQDSLCHYQLPALEWWVTQHIKFSGNNMIKSKVFIKELHFIKIKTRYGSYRIHIHPQRNSMKSGVWSKEQ